MSGKSTRNASTDRPSRTDWAQFHAADDRTIDYSDIPATSPEFWARARLRLPPRKIPVSIRLDEDVIGWFREQGSRYQTRMNAVLRAYVESQTSGSRSRAQALARYQEEWLEKVKAAEEKCAQLEQLRHEGDPEFFRRVRRQIEAYDGSRALKLPVLFFLLVRRDLSALERIDAVLKHLKKRNRKRDLPNVLDRLHREDEYRHAAGAIFEIDILARLLEATSAESVALYPKIGTTRKAEASLRIGEKTVYLEATLLSQTSSQERIQDIGFTSSLGSPTPAHLELDALDIFGVQDGVVTGVGDPYGDGLRVVGKLNDKRKQLHPRAPNVICLGLSDLMPDITSVEWGAGDVFSGSSSMARALLERATEATTSETLQRLIREARPEPRLTGVLVFQVEGSHVSPLRAMRNPHPEASAAVEDEDWNELLKLFDFPSGKPRGRVRS